MSSRNVPTCMRSSVYSAHCTQVCWLWDRQVRAASKYLLLV